MTDEEKKAWEGLVKEADCATAAGCGSGRLIHGHYRVEWEIAWRNAILAKDAECAALWEDNERLTYQAQVDKDIAGAFSNEFDRIRKDNDKLVNELKVLRVIKGINDFTEQEEKELTTLREEKEKAEKDLEKYSGLVCMPSEQWNDVKESLLNLKEDNIDLRAEIEQLKRGAR